MKKMMLGVLALAMLSTASAIAADLGRPNLKAAPVSYLPAEPIYNWTGFYVGGHLGGAFGGGSTFGRDARFGGGAQLGYDYQFAPNWVVGLEGQYSWLAGGEKTAQFGTFGLTRDRNGLGSVTGRLGYASGPGLLYVKGGYAYQDTKFGVRSLAWPGSVTFDGNKKNGYTVGAGVEYQLTPNWSTKLEYQYYGFGATDFRAVSPNGAVTTGSFDNKEHSVMVGLNYRFR